MDNFTFKELKGLVDSHTSSRWHGRRNSKGEIKSDAEPPVLHLFRLGASILQKKKDSQNEGHTTGENKVISQLKQYMKGLKEATLLKAFNKGK